MDFKPSLINLRKFMKISIGANLFEGPWGGGNLFVKNLSEYLLGNGHEVVFDLFSNDIDIILLTDPRKSSDSSSFNHKDIFNYLKYVNSQTLVVHRVNECDQRKGTKGLNEFIIKANSCADKTVFVSKWLQTLYEDEGQNNSNTVIMSGSDKRIFNNHGYKQWNGTERLKIVTHHWGSNWNKGFDIYSELDGLLSTGKYKDKIEFTYIGNLPNNFKFSNTKHIQPMSGKPLAKEIKTNHIYLTASKNEPSGNHHIEAAQCGLPVLYLNSGGMPEFCKNFGVLFEINNFEEKLNHIIRNYNDIEKNMKFYPFDAIKMSDEYLQLFNTMVKRKDEIILSQKDNGNEYTNSFLIYKIKKSFAIFRTKSKLFNSMLLQLNRIYLKIKSIILIRYEYNQ